MDFVTTLWIPIVLSAVIVFVGSSVMWMALPIHKKDYKKLGDKEAGVLAAVRSWSLAPGIYMFPGFDPKDRNSPETKAKEAAGPWGTIMVMPKYWNMGQMMGLWFLNLLIISFIVAYIANHALPATAPYLKVFQVVGAVAFLAYGGGSLTDSIWKGRPWNHLPGALFDAIVYACLTAGVFGWRWPHGV